MSNVVFLFGSSLRSCEKKVGSGRRGLAGRPPTPPYVLAVYGGFINGVTDHIWRQAGRIAVVGNPSNQKQVEFDDGLREAHTPVATGNLPNLLLGAMDAFGRDSEFAVQEQAMAEELAFPDRRHRALFTVREQFDFLGYTFGPYYSQRTGREYIGNSPSNKSVGQIKTKVGNHLVPSNVAPWAQVCERPNPILRGWRAYFGRGARSKAYRAVDAYVYDAVRRFLKRRHQVPSQGTRQFPEERVFGSLGVIRLQGPMDARL